MNNPVVRQAAVLLAAIGTVVVNGLANALPLNGQLTGEISDRFAVYFVPAGYVFAIWGLIYLGILGFAIWQALPAQRHNAAAKAIALPFIVSSVANSAWIFLWHYEQFPLTLAAMLTLLASLIVIYQRLGIGQRPTDRLTRWLAHVPFSIYLGWITVATVANATAVLYNAGWDGWGLRPEAWAVLMLLAAATIALAITFRRGDAAYVAVIVWALVGIAVKHNATVTVAGPALALAGVTALALWLLPRLRHPHARPYAA